MAPGTRIKQHQPQAARKSIVCPTIASRVHRAAREIEIVKRLNSISSLTDHLTHIDKLLEPCFMTKKNTVITKERLCRNSNHGRMSSFVASSS